MMYFPCGTQTSAHMQFFKFWNTIQIKGLWPSKMWCYNYIYEVTILNWAHFPIKTMTHRIKSKGKLSLSSWQAATNLLFCSPLSRSLHLGHGSRARCFSNTPADSDPIFLYLESPPNNREYQCLHSHLLSCKASVHIPPLASLLCPSENQPLIISISLTNDDNNGDEECQRNLIKMC